MAAPQGGFPPGGHPEDEYGQQQPYVEEQHGVAGSPTHGDASAQGLGPHGSKKKRAYAGQAYEFGAGPNAALGGQLQGGGAYGGYPAPQQPQAYQQGVYGAEPAQMAPQMVGQPEPVGGYQAPVEPYPSQPVNMGQVTQQMGQMNMGGQPAGQPMPVQRGAPLNTLYPTDLLTQPFNVAELDYPPPPIVLPPNVSGRALYSIQFSG